MVRRYERTEGSSKKFWELDAKGTGFVVRWGKVGASGRNEKAHAFASKAAATAAADKLVADKLAQGFALAGATAKPAKAAKPAAKDPGIEATLGAHPDDVASWQVYADWLIERGDPWGEVIAQAVAGRVPRKAQTEAAAAMLGGLDGSKLEWKHGAIARAVLHPEKRPATFDSGETPMEDALRRILAHPAGRLVRELDLGLPPSWKGDNSFDALVTIIAGAGPLPLLARLDLTHPADHMDQRSWRKLRSLAALWKAAPRLRELEVEASSGWRAKIDLGDLVAPHLEKLVFVSSGLDAGVPVALGKAKLPALRHLELYFGRIDYGNSCTIASLAGILGGKGLPALTHLGLENSEWDADLVTALAKSAILPRLAHLDLSKGVLYRDAAAKLLQHAAKFRHLKVLDLDDNYLWESFAEIKRAIPGAVGRDQRELDDEDPDDRRYTAIGE